MPPTPTTSAFLRKSSVLGDRRPDRLGRKGIRRVVEVFAECLVAELGVGTRHQDELVPGVVDDARWHPDHFSIRVQARDKPLAETVEHLVGLVFPEPRMVFAQLVEQRRGKLVSLFDEPPAPSSL
jgi:hypothetical protein